MKFYLLLICSVLLVAPLKGSKMSPQEIWEYKDGLKWRYFGDDFGNTLAGSMLDKLSGFVT